MTVGLLGGLVLLAGAGVASGRLWLLANYRPESVDGERRVARLGAAP